MIFRNIRVFLMESMRSGRAAVLQKTLGKEKAADRKLTQLGENGINQKAASQPRLRFNVRLNEAKSRAGASSGRPFMPRDQARRIANFAPQNAMTAPSPRAARPASTPASVGIALGAAAA